MGFPKTSKASFWGSRGCRTLQEVAQSIDYFAKKEGLDGHGKSVTIRFEDNK